MHISLDSALGRQRRLNSVGESVFQIAPNASAGYSLRSLTGGDPAVVRVRRASDNSEKDFNSSGVSSGELVNWVNAQIVPPLDVRELVDGERTGALIPAAAAYSLRNLSTSYTGNVVDVRRSSDDAEDSFTAAEVADGTLTDWVNEDVNLYTSDFSVDADGLTSSNGTLAGNIDGIDGVDDTLRFALSGGDTSHTVNVSNAGSGLSYTLSFDYYIPSANTALDGIEVQVTSSSYTSGILNVTDTWTTVNLTLTPDATGTLRFRTLDGGSATPDGDGDVLYIKNIVFTQTTADGFVTQWYDQSGNANHATQGTDASQPKIVDAGTLLNEIKFDGVDDVLNFTEIDFSTNSWMLSAVVDWDGTNSPIVGSVAGKWALQVATTNNFSARAINDSTIHNFDPTATITTGDGLFTVERSSDVLSGYYDGAFDDAAPAITASSVFRADKIGLRGSVYGSSAVKEIIIYNSDQSDNRTAFEANIGETYNIDLPSGVDTGYDQVDGFVETWYDQSGNGNDAVQATAGSQPKIVDAGVLVSGNTGEPAFRGDGVDDILSLSSSIDFGTGEFFVSTVVDVDTGGVAIGSGANWLLLVTLSSIQVRASNTRVVYVISPDSVLTAGESYLISLSRVENNITAYVNGVAQADVETVVSTDTFSADRFLQRGTNSNPYSDPVSEVIVYASDQSANRVAIETNINNQYDIY